MYLNPNPISIMYLYYNRLDSNLALVPLVHPGLRLLRQSFLPGGKNLLTGCKVQRGLFQGSLGEVVSVISERLPFRDYPVYAGMASSSSSSSSPSLVHP